MGLFFDFLIYPKPKRTEDRVGNLFKGTTSPYMFESNCSIKPEKNREKGRDIPKIQTNETEKEREINNRDREMKTAKSNSIRKETDTMTKE